MFFTNNNDLGDIITATSWKRLLQWVFYRRQNNIDKKLLVSWMVPAWVLNGSWIKKCLEEWGWAVIGIGARKLREFGLFLPIRLGIFRKRNVSCSIVNTYFPSISNDVCMICSFRVQAVPRTAVMDLHLLKSMWILLASFQCLHMGCITYNDKCIPQWLKHGSKTAALEVGFASFFPSSSHQE